MKFVLSFIAAIFASGAAAQVSVAYLPESGNSANRLNIYADSAVNAPVIIYVHGGAWVAGNHHHVNAKPAHFVGDGFVFVSVGYSLVPDKTVNGQLLEIDAAIGWVAKNIAQYGGDPDNIHLMGHSAGAHLVAMTAVRPLAQAAPLIASGAIRTVVSNDTRAYDLPRIAAMARGGRLPRLYANVFGDDPAGWQQLSPIFNITNSRKPVFLLAYSGQGNDAVRRSFAEEFAAALIQSGGQVELFDGSAFSHVQINKLVGKNNTITAAIDGFLMGQR